MVSKVYIFIPITWLKVHMIAQHYKKCVMLNSGLHDLLFSSKCCMSPSLLATSDSKFVKLG